jgi:hypothetical protein
MKRALRLLAATLSALLLLAVGQFKHVSAMQMPHDMMGMNHGSSAGSSLTCATLCSTMTVGKKEMYDTVVRKDEDEPEPPYYRQFQANAAQLNCLHSQKPLSADLPLKVPIHIRHCVFRS